MKKTITPLFFALFIGSLISCNKVNHEQVTTETHANKSTSVEEETNTVAATYYACSTTSGSTTGKSTAQKSNHTQSSGSPSSGRNTSKKTPAKKETKEFVTPSNSVEGETGSGSGVGSGGSNNGADTMKIK